MPLVFSQRSYEGYLLVDHRASPGLTEQQARVAGFDPALVREGSVYEAPTLGCCHCGTAVVMNPKRTRERAFCQQCDRYICDWCAAARKDTGYVHRTFSAIADMIRSGKWEFRGTGSRPLLIPKGAGDG